MTAPAWTARGFSLRPEGWLFPYTRESDMYGVVAKKILLGLLLLIVAFVVLVAAQPAEYSVERSRSYDVPPEAAFAVVSDLSRFDAWSPWAEKDRNMKIMVAGKPGTIGQSYAWSGDENVGSGKQTITAVVPGKEVVIHLEFLEPFQGEATTAFEVEEAKSGTKVTWRMSGKNDFMGKAVGLFMNMEEMIGADYDKGLEKLDPLLEAEAMAAQETEPESEPDTEGDPANPDTETDAE